MNKIALVTGASRGIGAATAKLFAAKGYTLCINYHTNQQAALSVKDDILKANGRAEVCQADISKPEDVRRLFAFVDTMVGELAVLVNNAAMIQPQAKLVEMDAKRVNQLMATNVTGPLICCGEAVKRMAKSEGGGGGVIVNVSSAAARTGSPFEYIDYAASKGAIDSLTMGLAKEVANEGIRVNGVRPGLIYTDIHASAGEADRVGRLKHKLPLQRGGQPEEIAEAIYWLASDKSAYCTGSILDISGGL